MEGPIVALSPLPTFGHRNSSGTKWLRYVVTWNQTCQVIGLVSSRWKTVRAPRDYAPIDVLHVLFGGLGGQTDVVRGLAVEFARRGLSSGVCLIGRPGAQTSARDLWPSVDGIWTLDKRHRLDVGLSRAARAVLLKARPRAVLWHSQYASPALLRPIRPAAVRVVITVEHQPIDLRSFGNDARSFGSLIAADAMVVLSEDYRRRHPLRRVSQLLRHRIDCIPNGVDTDLFRPRPDWCSDAASSTEGLTFGMAARFVALKDIESLLRGFARFVADRDGCDDRLVLIGDGPERGRLESVTDELGLTSRVEFTGLVPPEEVPSQLRRLDVYVQSTHGETHSTSILQAQATGLPVIGSAVVGVKEAIVDEVDGLLVPPESPNLLAQAFRRLVDNAELRRALGVEARAKVLASSTRRQMSDRYAEFLRELDPEGPWSAARSQGPKEHV